ncbi:putative helicase-like protein [Leptomonas pyrrhocoris]|uniref:Putative helicase-like protein n=1 Tax=Leptomonas pyrrhocoris TaxID=157538 RepID=A0A0M9G0K6_LEPPY|nr:putative helicase-like protein [Leptomonas pyrrhocoris]KPA79727.1 putative helicase-like protein [Leptomonas pyrrhocoris]|eukprot:XP_015658166.1 putative helicase-like protein [Leptomonas pyrrhocoris]
MNLDNYFARFLHKSNGKAVGKKEEAVPLPGVPVVPSRPPTTLKAGGGVTSSSPEHADGEGRNGRASGDAGVVPSYARTSLDGAGGSAGPASKVVDRNVDVVSSSKRLRDEDVAVEVFSPTTAKRVLARRGHSEEDEDELALLLGSQEARQVKKVDAMLEEIARAQQQAAAAPSSHASSPVAASKEDDFDASTACTMGSLAWHKSSARALETIARYFQRQFEFDLRHNAELFNVFEPFFKDRALSRIAQDAELRPFFYPAPAVTNESVGALAGCVLRSYQVEGVQFLLDRFHRGMSCILADDMGLGKTAQISAFLHTLRQLHSIEGPHLVIAPLSTLTSWTRELARWAPQLRVVKYHGERQTRMLARAGHHNRHAVFVTTPALIQHDRGFFRKRSWVTVIVDEAHVLKTHDTAITSVSRKLTACYRVAVTGTPVHNNVQEVWSLLSFLYPWLMAGYDPSVRDPVRQAEECARVLQFIMLRRTKADMELGIPPRIDEPLTKLAPTYVQQHLLSQLTTHALREGNTGHQLHGHLSHQRAVCNHPLTLRLLADENRTTGSQKSVEDRMKAAGIPMDAAHIIDPSAKMRYLHSLLPKLKAAGHRCLIFSNFTATLDLLEAMCHLCDYSYERLDGSCNRVERELAMLRYNHPTSSCFLFLVTTTAGGVGVTLTGADTVVLFDAHFNPQLDRQAADRAHRIGQTRTVHVYRLCLEGTVEEHIRGIAAGKASLGDFIVEGGKGGQRRNGGGGSADGAGAARITAEDIREMFRRLEQQKTHNAASGSANSLNFAPLVEDTDGHAEENAMIADLLAVEDTGLPGSAAAGPRGGGGVGSLGSPPKQTHECFCCGGIMHPMEPLYHCMVCPKAYHAACIGARTPKPGETLKRQWTCPRHVCSLCGKPQSADGAIFMCDACPRSFCFDCLDPRYLEMDPTGARLLHIRSTYADMAKEEMEVKRSCYYITCLRCCGVVSPSSSSSSAGSAGDDDGDDNDAGESDSGEVESSEEAEVEEEDNA